MTVMLVVLVGMTAWLIIDNGSGSRGTAARCARRRCCRTCRRCWMAPPVAS
ncbi:hypothetical protein HBB16_00750 [Pseudonocardia sp. MCCB 268]|nr:hypothetical protein [Pseudonocardia cytotoxica]